MKFLLSVAISALAFSGTVTFMEGYNPHLSEAQLIFFSAIVGLLFFLLINLSPDFLAPSTPSIVAVDHTRRGAVSHRIAAPIAPKPAGAIISILWGAIRVEIPMTAVAAA